MKLRCIIAVFAIIAAVPEVFCQIEKRETLAVDSLDINYEDLDEFVLTVKKEVIKSDGAKLTYDMDADDSSKGQSVLDALRKVPMVTVDGQDNIYIQGNQNFKIYVNGKEEPMLTANASKVLKAMPSESVSKIEVITEPGAKYDAEGVGGILNLVTERKQTKEGYTGSAGVSFSSQNIGANLYGRMKYDKVTADMSVNYANNSLQKQSMRNSSVTYDYNSDDQYMLQDKMIQKFTFDYIGANLNMSWEPTSNDLFTVGGHFNGVLANIKKLDDTSSMFNRDGILQWSNLQHITGSMNNIGASGNTSYRRLFSNSGNSLTVAYAFNYGYNPWDMNYINSTEYGNATQPPYQKNENTTYQREHTITADYLQPIKDDRHKIETGAKGIFRHNSQITEMSTGLDPDHMHVVTDDMGRTNQIQNIYALYASYNGNFFDKISVTAGLRYEHTYMGLDFPMGNYESFRRDLNDIVPNAAVSYMFGPATNLRLAYQMRINRPAINQLNPTVFQMTQTMATVGNPNLTSEHYNSLSLTYTNFGRVIGGNIGINLYQSNNTIESYDYFRDGVTYSTYGNFGRNQKAELTGFLNWNVNNSMSVSLNGSINYTIIKSHDSLIQNHGWNGQYGGNFNYTGPWNVKYSLYGGQMTGMVRLQGKFNGWNYYGLGISKSFLKDDALTIAINASNFFTKYSHFKNTNWSKDHFTQFKAHNRAWNVGISIIWNFGHLKDQVKKTGARLENNDTKSTETGGQQGIGL